MSIAILQTKLYVPGSSARDRRTLLVSRQRLIQKLDEGLASKLITVCAPAGFGKSTLLSTWVMQNAQVDEMAWLSLDEGDNDAIRFWAHFVAALQHVGATIGATTVALLQSPQLLPAETLLTVLLNDLNARAADMILVLDDFHLVNTAAIHKGLLFLLDHMPPQLHIIVSSRADPPWPLARWRGQNQLTEVRADDLRFTLEEAATFLQEVMGLSVSAADILTLDRRMEGWVAGLQLVALSLRGATDSARLIHAFSGTNRYIVDYLVEEVLARQSEEVQHFLLQSSILERLCGPLCDAKVSGKRRINYCASLVNGSSSIRRLSMAAFCPRCAPSFRLPRQRGATMSSCTRRGRGQRARGGRKGS